MANMSQLLPRRFRRVDTALAVLYYRPRIVVQSADESPDGERLLLTVPEAAQTLRISRWKLYDYIHRRQLRTVKFGARRLVPASALAALIDRLSEETL
jgi:excisionase family DNA binding protein